MRNCKTVLNTVFAGVALAAMALPAHAAEHEVKMLNKGEKGIMVFEPDLVRAAPGDTIHFISVDAGHNAETIDGMIPEGAETFKGKPSKDVTVTLGEEGVYGIRCTPHYGMGMVALIVVGEPTNLAEAEKVKNPGKAKKKFADLFDRVKQ
ncbi:pseudoazurin [Jiella pacifica]|uniref:Pseudoazurin n=1 Tax=Jiella pacifica TaxID=2696469 RepID=A0A6N9T8A7_9HYPH|nr:pseudoazurin [Jiella pacifica]NDW07667.1 pseudoazurin [Jiella pacifica]